MKKILCAALIATPISSFAFCPLPNLTGNSYADQRAQMAYQNCLNNEQYQQQQLQLQRQQVQIQQQQLQLQQQQMNQIQPAQPNFNILQPIQPIQPMRPY